MSEAHQELRRELGRLRGDWRGRQVALGLCLTLAVTGVVLAGVVALDNLLRAGPFARVIMALAVWGTLGATGALFVVRRWLAERRDDFFAALVEQKHPELRNALINAVQLGRGTPYGSPRVIQAICTDATRSLAALDPTDALDPRPLRQATLAMLGVVALLAVYALALSPWFWNGLHRVLRPAADIPPYSTTQILEASVKPGNVRVPEGSAVLLEARVTGSVPDAARWWVTTASGILRYNEVKAEAVTPGLFRFALPAVNESFAYALTAGDGRSRQYRVTVVKRPRVERLAVTCQLPAYTAVNVPRHGGADGAIAGLAGTEVTLELQASKALREARIVTEGESAQTVPLRRAGSDLAWQGRFILWSREAKGLDDATLPKVLAPARYRVEMLDTDGYETQDDTWRSLMLVKDQPPRVTLVQPGHDVQVKADAALKLGVTAQDDYGIGDVRLQFRVNEAAAVQELARFPHTAKVELETQDTFEWKLAGLGLKPGDVVRYWAIAADRNPFTGPGTAESKTLAIIVASLETLSARFDVRLEDYARTLEEILRHQRENRAQTASGQEFPGLVKKEGLIRAATKQLADAMTKDAFPAESIIQKLNEVAAGDMAEAIRLLESGGAATEDARAAEFRAQSLPVQDRIIELLAGLLARLQRDEQARGALKKLAKTDAPAHKIISDALTNVVENLDHMIAEELQLADKFERLPKQKLKESSEAVKDVLSDLDQFQKKWGKWAKGSVDELTKLPSTFIEDFSMLKDMNKIYEEIEPAAHKRKLEKFEVSIEDNGMNLSTKWLKEDTEIWSMFDVPDFQFWNLEEPLAQKPLEIPEMPLPDSLEDKIGDLLQKGEDVDEETDDITSAWAGNLDYAGKGQALDGPGSCFSPKAMTGNVPPSNNEVGGRGADGRRGKSSGQMIGSTTRSLEGRSTPARAGNERYEPGVVKQEKRDDPNGSTGGGKKSGSGRKGLQGGTPPDFVRDMQRLSAKTAGVRERAERVVNDLGNLGIYNRRLIETIGSLKTAEQEFKDLRYEDAARRQRVALGQMKAALTDIDSRTAVQLSRARAVPKEMREEIVQGVEETFPDGYEDLLKSYFRTLSDSE